MFWLYKVIIRGLHVKEGITDPGNPYDVIQKQSLLDWMDKENMRNFGGPLVTTAWRVLRFRMEEAASRYAG
jgi:hypothetical protein